MVETIKVYVGEEKIEYLFNDCNTTRLCDLVKKGLLQLFLLF